MSAFSATVASAPQRGLSICISPDTAGRFANDNRYHSSSAAVAAADVNFLSAQAMNGFVTNGLMVSKPLSSTASSRASDRRD